MTAPWTHVVADQIRGSKLEAYHERSIPLNAYPCLE